MMMGNMRGEAMGDGVVMDIRSGCGSDLALPEGNTASNGAVDEKETNLFILPPHSTSFLGSFLRECLTPD